MYLVLGSRHRDWNLITCARVRRYQRGMCAELESVAGSNDLENPPFDSSGFLFPSVFEYGRMRSSESPGRLQPGLVVCVEASLGWSGFRWGGGSLIRRSFLRCNRRRLLRGSFLDGRFLCGCCLLGRSLFCHLLSGNLFRGLLCFDLCPPLALGICNRLPCLRAQFPPLRNLLGWCGSFLLWLGSRGFHSFLCRCPSLPLCRSYPFPSRRAQLVSLACGGLPVRYTGQQRTGLLELGNFGVDCGENIV